MEGQRQPITYSAGQGGGVRRRVIREERKEKEEEGENGCRRSERSRHREDGAVGVFTVSRLADKWCFSL